MFSEIFHSRLDESISNQTYEKFNFFHTLRRGCSVVRLQVLDSKGGTTEDMTLGTVAALYPNVSQMNLRWPGIPGPDRT